MVKGYTYIMVLFLLLPLAIATPTITFNDPDNKTYISSINIPIDVTITDANYCKYNLTSTKESFVDQVVTCGNTYRVDVNFDTSYNLTYYGRNTTTLENMSNSVSFDVDTDITGKGYLIGGIIIS